MNTSIDETFRVFLCHSSEDKAAVRELYNLLTKGGINAWLDEKSLLPGQDWKVEIPKAIKKSQIVVVCLSNKSITKEGYIQKEIKFALDIADEKPEGTIYVIPIKLEECDVPERLKRWQWLDLSDENGYNRLLKAFEVRANELGIKLNIESEYHKGFRSESKSRKAIDPYFQDNGLKAIRFDWLWKTKTAICLYCGPSKLKALKMM